MRFDTDMSSDLQIAWAVPKSDDLDVKDFALQLLESAKENLQRDGELLSVAFVVTSDQRRLGRTEAED